MITKMEINGFFQSIRNGRERTVKQMIAANAELVNTCRSAPPKKDDGQSPLQVAFKTGRFKIAGYLIDQGANVNHMEKSKINTWRAPVLHDALRAAAFTAGTREFRDAVALIKRMLESGADSNAVDSYGNNCLMRAILDARIVLPQDGAKPRARLLADVAVIFSTLIENGADVHASNRKRRASAFQEAQGTLLERLLT